MKKLFWCTTPCGHEDWFSISENKSEAQIFHECAEGFDENYAKAKFICDVSDECDKMNSNQNDDEGYWPTHEQLEYLGGTLIEDVSPRVVLINGIIYREGGAAQSLLKKHLNKRLGVYVVQIRGTNKCKIGKTKRIKKRIKELRTGNPEAIDLKVFMITRDASKLEKILHNEFKNQNIGGEWFSLSEENLAGIMTIGHSEKAHVVDADAFRRG